MKKIIGILLGGVICVQAIADTQPPMPPRMDPECKPAFEHMKANHDKLEAAIKANDANTVGKIVIADHNYMESFIATHPQCKPPRPPKVDN